MGLASALSTALTGLSAAETQIDVIGNNLANSQTVGFKDASVTFATQFVKTQGLGSGPSDTSGGTNPRQIGAGVQVAAITPNFDQGPVELSASPSDLALQGDGFFIVETGSGERNYTRNGIFQLNSNNELVSFSGGRLLGYGVDENFDLQTGELAPLSIPIGTSLVAQETRNVVMQGILNSTGAIADTAEVIQSSILGDGSIPRADATGTDVNISPIPDAGPTTLAGVVGGSLNPSQTYEYQFAFADANGTETMPSVAKSVTLGLGEQTVSISNLPGLGGTPEYSLVNVYRKEIGGASNEFHFIGQTTQGAASFVDNGIPDGPAYDQTSLNGDYKYVITYYKNGEGESRPSVAIDAGNIADGRFHIQNVPAPPVPGPGDTFPAYDEIRVYRNLSTDDDSFHLVATLNPGDSFTDNRSDADISDTNNPVNNELDFDGPKINLGTLLTDVTRVNALNNYDNIFEEGTLTFTGIKGGANLKEKAFDITATSTVQDLVEFMSQAMGIQDTNSDPTFPIPDSKNNIVGESGSLNPGGSIVGGRIRFVANNGVANAIDIDSAHVTLTNAAGTTSNPFVNYSHAQAAVGESTSSQFIVYDSLGVAIDARITAVLESRNASGAVFRWYADSAGNDPANGDSIAIGTGLLTFDSNGNLTTVSNDSIQILRETLPSASPIDIKLDFASLSGLSGLSSSLFAASQDGSSTGNLVNYGVNEDGTISGLFSNDSIRTLGQIRLARFTNLAGLEQRSLNKYAPGANSGLPIMGNPGESGLASIVSGALELSNTDIGRSLVDLVVATSQYRGNARVISAAQDLLDELLNLRR